MCALSSMVERPDSKSGRLWVRAPSGAPLKDKNDDV